VVRVTRIPARWRTVHASLADAERDPHNPQAADLVHLDERAPGGQSWWVRYGATIYLGASCR
jgi:hypothetical protein